jgi:hypothetical protein
MIQDLSCHVTHVDWNEVGDHLPRLHIFDIISEDTVIMTTLTQRQKCRHMPLTTYSPAQKSVFLFWVPQHFLDFVSQSKPRQIFFLAPIGRPRYDTKKTSSMALGFGANRSRAISFLCILYGSFRLQHSATGHFSVVFSHFSLSFIRPGTCPNHRPFQPAKQST